MFNFFKHFSLLVCSRILKVRYFEKTRVEDSLWHRPGTPDESLASDASSHVLSDGPPPCGSVLWLRPVFVSVHPWAWCQPACRVSHTEPNAANVSAHGTVWRRRHGWPGGAKPERSPRYPAGHPHELVSDNTTTNRHFIPLYYKLISRFQPCVRFSWVSLAPAVLLKVMQ